MERKSIGRFSAEQIEQARRRYAQMPKRPIVDMTEAMKTPEDRRKVQESIDHVMKVHAHALKILKDR
ncbi:MULTISPECIES: hypothetical protein [Burkholderiaceae]|uniref:hypothetical protein n=1 Tax=Burkholderiaceae TaxID=119060 RepID=UPI000968F02A|nr:MULTISPECIES: hypothetical protein [Burkholderiaceae]MCF2133859.1 hypothetical protein [Mycetohabitans sp. B3]MCG1038812.1 hypothetical protein [Mycetohabitans sp. B7]SIT68772.1 hypothetical protein SAMN04487769_1384 [Burkholderia sp. b14]